jgi:DnaJ-class molecular chaperone
MFKLIAQAYEVLSDAALRERYHLLGPEAVQSDIGHVDPRELFTLVCRCGSASVEFGPDRL